MKINRYTDVCTARKNITDKKWLFMTQSMSRIAKCIENGLEYIRGAFVERKPLGYLISILFYKTLTTIQWKGAVFLLAHHIVVSS